MNTYVTGMTIKALREKRHFTQAELADRIGVSSKTVSKWEKGLSVPDAQTLQRIAEEFSPWRRLWAYPSLS